MIEGQFRVLVLTDHSNHGESNSLYAIMQRMRRHKKCRHIDIVSRGNTVNNSFFEGQTLDNISAHRVDDNFMFSSTNNILEHDLRPINIENYDLLMLRLPRPISDEFLLWLDDVFSEISIINKPSGIIKTSSKAFLLNFPDLCPPIKLVHSINEILEFSKEHTIVLKPLREYGGKGLIKIKGGVIDDGIQLHDTLDYLETIKSTIQSEGYLAMKFLKNVNQGDKRIIVVGGTIMASSLRLPAVDSWLCNVAQGGTSVYSEVTDEEKIIVKEIAPKLRDEGILIYGVDTLVNDNGLRVLSEINTLSVGGFHNSQEQTGLPIIQMTVDKIFNYAINN